MSYLLVLGIAGAALVAAGVPLSDGVQPVNTAAVRHNSAIRVYSLFICEDNLYQNGEKDK
jgi:hypothetical protein